MEKKLTLKQNKFVKEYIKKGNGTKAAIKAGYSKNCAQQIASENLLKPVIKLKIEKVMSELSDKIGMTAEKVLLKLNEVLDDDNDKHKMKAIELAGKHHKLWHENDLNVKLSEEERHKETQKILEGLA